MKAYVITLVLIDIDKIGGKEIRTVIENQQYPNHCISPTVAAIQSRDIGKWSDDHALNQSGSQIEWVRLFPLLRDVYVQPRKGNGIDTELFDV